MIDGVQTAPAAAPAPIAKQTRGGATYEVYSQKVSQPLSCTLIGQPERLGSTGYSNADCRSLNFPSGTFGLGLGAFGEGFTDCESRFGEFLAAGGCAIALPTSDADAMPDFIVEQGGLVPRVETLYALAGKGDFSAMVRFDALAENTERLNCQSWWARSSICLLLRLSLLWWLPRLRAWWGLHCANRRRERRLRMNCLPCATGFHLLPSARAIRAYACWWELPAAP